jgi:hypothetical protein
MHWRVARISRQAGARQAQSELGRAQVSLNGFENQQKSLLGRARQARQGDSGPFHMKKATRREINHGAKQPAPQIKSEVSHVRLSRNPDQPDQADRARKSAASDGQAQLSDPDQTLPMAEQTLDHHKWSRTTSKQAARTLWAERPDVILVVEDLVDGGMRPGRISHELGLTRAEMLVILRRSGR